MDARRVAVRAREDSYHCPNNRMENLLTASDMAPASWQATYAMQLLRPELGRDGKRDQLTGPNLVAQVPGHRLRAPSPVAVAQGARWFTETAGRRPWVAA